MKEGAVSRPALRRTLLAGAVYDLVLGLFILFLGRTAMARLGHPLPDHAVFYFSLASLPLLVLPALSAAAARATDPDPFRPAVLWARGAGGALVLLLALTLRPEPLWLFLIVGTLDGVWACLHAALWRR